jgi:hypothetical protein
MYEVAVHEAGHAVLFFYAHWAVNSEKPAIARVAIARGVPKLIKLARLPLPPEIVICDIKGVCDGCRLLPDKVISDISDRPREFRALLDRPLLRLGDRLEWSIIIDLAGHFAQVVANERAPRYGARQDYATAKKTLAALRRVVGQRLAMRLFEERARKVVRHQWSAIAALASELSKAEILEYEEARQIIVPLMLKDASAPLRAPQPAGRSKRRGN